MNTIFKCDFTMDEIEMKICTGGTRGHGSNFFCTSFRHLKFFPKMILFVQRIRFCLFPFLFFPFTRKISERRANKILRPGNTAKKDTQEKYDARAFEILPAPSILNRLATDLCLHYGEFVKNARSAFRLHLCCWSAFWMFAVHTTEL